MIPEIRIRSGSFWLPDFVFALDAEGTSMFVIRKKERQDSGRSPLFYRKVSNMW